MRKLLILSVLVVMAAGATGCVSQNPCGGNSWRPGYYLFGLGRNQQPTQADACCDPCGGGAMAAPMMTAAPCCQ